MIYSISAVLRTNMAKRSKDELLESRIPAVLYGNKVASQSIAVPRSEFLKVFRGAGQSSLIDISLPDQTPVKALVKEYQLDILTNEFAHIDFYQVRMDEELTAEVPLKFIGESRAVKSDGGTLIKSLDKIEISCLPVNLPHEIEVDLSVLVTFEDAVTVASLQMPTGVKAVTDGALTIATVARPLTEDELKKLDESAAPADVTAIKTEGEEKKAADEAKKAEEAAADAATKK